MPPKKRKSESNAAASNTPVDTDEEKDSKRSRRIEESSKKAAENALKFGLEWSSFGKNENSGKVEPLLRLISSTEPGCSKVAGFDIDNTLIVTKSGRNFATNAQDWKWFDKTVPDKLKELHANGHRVLFVTNQAGIEKGKVKFGTELKPKFEAMVRDLDIPVFILVATGENHFRKPATEMWTHFVEKCNQGVSVDKNESFYVGDAAGRPKNWAPGKPKDFSCTDRMFASNVGIKFYTPEEFFLKHKSVPFEWGSIDPNKLLEKHKSIKNGSEEKKKYHLDEQELVLFCGPPASGKSTLFRRYFKAHNYVHVNRDTMSTQAACLKATEQALAAGKSVCVDNTNPSRKVRAEYIDLARKHKLRHVRCFVMQTDIELCHHLNYVRQTQTRGEVRRVPDVGYNVYKGQWEEPKSEEGFTDIVKVNFVPDFDSEQDEKIFRQWTA